MVWSIGVGSVRKCSNSIGSESGRFVPFASSLKVSIPTRLSEVAMLVLALANPESTLSIGRLIVVGLSQNAYRRKRDLLVKCHNATRKFASSRQLLLVIPSRGPKFYSRLGVARLRNAICCLHAFPPARPIPPDLVHTIHHYWLKVCEAISIAAEEH